jgi:hypothetical protein
MKFTSSCVAGTPSWQLPSNLIIWKYKRVKAIKLTSHFTLHRFRQSDNTNQRSYINAPGCRQTFPLGSQNPEDDTDSGKLRQEIAALQVNSCSNECSSTGVPCSLHTTETSLRRGANKLRGFWSASELYRLGDRRWAANFKANI